MQLKLSWYYCCGGTIAVNQIINVMRDKSLSCQHVEEGATLNFIISSYCTSGLVLVY